MRLLVLDPTVRAELIAERRRTGGDRFDEVWDGVYMMSPLANNEHQTITGRLYRALDEVVGDAGQGIVQPGANVSDRGKGWKRNYRCPDVVVYLNGNPALNHNTHWQGGPDFAVEVVSRHDRSRKKLDFYAKVGVRELLIVDRRPWSLELYRLNEAGVMVLVGGTTVEQPDPISSVVLPLTFVLEVGEDRPQVRVTHTSGAPSWLA